MGSAWGHGAERSLGAIALAAYLLLLAPAALAAPPGNDDFEDASALSAGVPVAATGTNVEATREEGEPFLLFGAGHSIWYEWEATGTDFVTVGTCGSAFEAEVGIYTGSAVNALSKIADNSDGGPGCASNGRQATFKAVNGTTYKIGVDGNGFYLPEWPKPVTEGAVALQVDATPTPPNDAFSSAAELVGSVEEEPGEPPFYFASARGYNWGASKETDEPEHAGDPGGASVWFNWTAPATGIARLSSQGNWFEPLLAIYGGSALNALTPLASGGFLGIEEVPVTAGTIYRIAVDGKRDSGSGEADTAGFTLMLNMQLPPGFGQAPSPGPTPTAAGADTTPPDTTIRRHALKRRPPIWVFNFESTEAGSTFRCKLDKGRFRRCGVRWRYGHLAPARHALRVFAVDAAGNADPSPAVARFAVPAKPKAQGRY